MNNIIIPASHPSSSHNEGGSEGGAKRTRRVQTGRPRGVFRRPAKSSTQESAGVATPQLTAAQKTERARTSPHQKYGGPRTGATHAREIPPSKIRLGYARPTTVHVNEPHVRVVPLGGLEEIGKNMMYLEYVDPGSPQNGDILIIDMGFMFPDENMPGIDYVIPQVASLIPKRKKIRGVIITHAHMDHIGAIPYLMPVLGADIPLFSTDITIAIIKKRQEDFRNGNHSLNLKVITNDTKLKLGAFYVSFYSISHNIPGAMGVVIDTPVGTMVHTGDFKLDTRSDIAGHTDVDAIKALGKKNALLLMSDSTDARAPGRQYSEIDIQIEIEKIFNETPGRLYFATFASLLGRINEILLLAQKYKRKVVIDGRSMRTNVAIATELGYMKFDPSIIVPIEKIHEYPKEKFVILVTGAQGESNAVLMRIVNKRHKQLRIEPGDTVIFSSSVIPGNERTVQALTDKLYRDGAEVINYKMLDIHAGGHAKQEDLKDMIRYVQPRFFMPVHGQHAFLKIHAKLARELGYADEQLLVADDGQVLIATKKRVWLTNEKVPANHVMVDGLGVGDVQEIVIRDRQAMASDGIFVIIAVVDAQTGKVRGSPDIISRGFVYIRDSKDLISETRRRILHLIEETTKNMHPINFQYVRENLREKVGQFLFQRTERRPMILPVVIEV